MGQSVSWNSTRSTAGPRCLPLPRGTTVLYTGGPQSEALSPKLVCPGLSYPPPEKGQKQKIQVSPPPVSRPAIHLSLWELALGDTEKGEQELQVLRAAPPEQHFKGRSAWLHPHLLLRSSPWGEGDGPRAKDTGLRGLSAPAPSRTQGSGAGRGSTVGEVWVGAENIQEPLI